jgi:hypothetical protein
MNRFSQKEHKALMADLSSSCSGQLPSVGIFWYNPQEHALYGVRKEELSPVRVDAAASDGLPFINYPELHRDVWKQLHLPGEYDVAPRGRVSWVIDKFVVLVGEWARPIEEELSLIIEKEFSLPLTEFVFSPHF